jgi:predicted aldo/keto reductase-like oxidoreductase
MTQASSRRNFLAAGLAAPGGMAPRMLGKTGLKVFPLGFGGRGTSDAPVVERAADLGINYFDTGRNYANNERLLGVALKDRRKQVVLSSKSAAKTKKDALAELETSLRELQTDYLDIWLLHGVIAPEEITEELLEAQREAKQAGKIRFAGVSTHLNMPAMLEHVLKLGQHDVMLAAYNFTMKPEVTEAIRKARKAGLGIIAMKVMAGGISRIQTMAPRFEGSPEALVRTLQQEGAMHAALRWALKNESVDTSAVLMGDFEQVEENVKAVARPYSGADEKLLGARVAEIGAGYCRMCGACGGVCEKGVPVADTLRFLTYAESYGDFPLARSSFLALPEKARRIRCRDCVECTVRCANGVRVRARLERAQEMLA